MSSGGPIERQLDLVAKKAYLKVVFPQDLQLNRPSPRPARELGNVGQGTTSTSRRLRGGCFQGCPAYTPNRTRSPRMSAVRMLSRSQSLFYAPCTINVKPWALETFCPIKHGSRLPTSGSAERAPVPSALSIDRQGRAVNHFGIVAAQKQDHTRDVLRLRPLSKICVGHCFPVHFCVDDAGKNRVHAHAGAL
jgi:hypothetical protein